MGSNDLPRGLTASRAFADTVQTEPPAAAGDPAAGESLPAPDSDLGLELAGEADIALAERPTLSHIGRYALKTLLGEGGLGRVYEAWDPLLSRTVAVKTLQFDLDMPSRLALDRQLLNEARAAANLSHAHIVTIHDAGLSAHGVYIAMERLRGHDLRHRLAAGWRPSPETAAQIVRRVADALAYAHARGVVHCDIKPGNIFLTRKDRPKVLDFGIARIAHATARPQGEAEIVGSPHYLAPEQLDGGAVDARTDLYALGVVLYELLAGRKAFPGDTLEQIHAAVRAGQATPLLELQPALPPALADIVARAMDPVAERRFASASELSKALREWAASVAEPAVQPVPAPSVGTAQRARRWTFAAIGTLGVVALAAVLAARMTSGGAPGSPADGTRPNPAETTARKATPALATDTRPAAAPTATLPMAADPATEAPVAARAAAPTAPPVMPPSGVKTASRAAAAGAHAPVAAAAVRPAAAPATPAVGSLQIAVSPWGEIEVDGKPAGTTPPLTQLSLSEGSHRVTIRNADFPPFTTTVQVQADRPVSVRHRFGS